MYVGDLECHDHSHIFSLVSTEVVSQQVQQPITNFTRPWDDFIFHGMNNPLVYLWLVINLVHGYELWVAMDEQKVNNILLLIPGMWKFSNLLQASFVLVALHK